MTCIMSRRRLLSLSAAGLLAGCTTTSHGSTATATLDVAKIVEDCSVMLSGLSVLLTMPALIVALGTGYVVAVAALAAAQVALTSIETLNGSSINVSVDTSKLQPLVRSLLDDVQTVLRLVQDGVAKLTGSVATRVDKAVTAVLTLIPFVQLAAGFVGAMPETGAMDEQQALATLRRGA